VVSGIRGVLRLVPGCRRPVISQVCDTAAGSDSQAVYWRYEQRIRKFQSGSERLSELEGELSVHVGLDR